MRNYSPNTPTSAPKKLKTIDELLASARLRGNPSAAAPAPAPAAPAPVPAAALVADVDDAKAAAAAAVAATAAAAAALALTLPKWGDGVRCIPNSILRSALFAGVTGGKKEEREHIYGEDIASIDGINIRYKGEKLDQIDLSVWSMILHQSRNLPLGSICNITSYALIMAMGKTDTGENRELLKDSIERLVATAATLKNGPDIYMGSLIANAARHDETKMWAFGLDTKLMVLFHADQFTLVDESVRRALRGKPLAQWLHGFYSSHAQPYPMKAQTFVRLSGSKNNTPRSWMQKLKQALDALAVASAANGQPFAYEFKDGLVHVEKTPTNAQSRHLAKKAKNPRKPR